MDKYQGKYRIPSARLQTWDYSNPGIYFITICTAKKKNFFGEIEKGKMILSPTGVIADILWMEIKNHAKNIQLGEFIIMPNHMHGILILEPEEIDSLSEIESLMKMDSPFDMESPMDMESQSEIDPPSDIVQTRHALSLHNPGKKSHPGKNSYPGDKLSPGQNRHRNPEKNSISSIIGRYKSAVTKHARRLGFEFAWHPRFYDHIIRDQKAFHNISNYIINNPKKWKDDKLNGGKGNQVLEPKPTYGEIKWADII